MLVNSNRSSFVLHMNVYLELDTSFMSLEKQILFLKPLVFFMLCTLISSVIRMWFILNTYKQTRSSMSHHSVINDQHFPRMGQVDKFI